MASTCKGGRETICGEMALLKENAMARLSDAWQAGRLAHAYLLTGPEGSGKEWLAGRLAELVLETGDAEGHPDFHRVGPESKSRRIVIEQMRSMEHALQMKPLVGRTKVAVVGDADRLQPQAANAFLKTLEEPPPGCHIFLLTALPEAVLETILSRCIAVPLRPAAPPVVTGDAAEVSRALVGALLEPGGAGVAGAMRFTRVVQRAISAIRERVTAELQAELKQELKTYKDGTDSKWQSEREEQIKARAEAAVVGERQALLHAVEVVLAGALRFHHLPAETCGEDLKKVAAAHPAAALIRRLEALDRTRDLLARGVQEGLALESGFLEMIAGQ